MPGPGTYEPNMKSVLGRPSSSKYFYDYLGLAAVLDLKENKIITPVLVITHMLINRENINLHILNSSDQRIQKLEVLALDFMKFHQAYQTSQITL